MREQALLRRWGETPPSRFSRLDPRLKILIALIWIGVVSSTPHTQPLQYAAHALILLLMIVVGGVPSGQFLFRLSPILPFALVALAIPFLHAGRTDIVIPWFPDMTREGLVQALEVLARMFLIGGVVALVAVTTPFAELLEALRAFHVPPSIVLSFGLMFRFLFLLVEEGHRVHRAMLSRGGNWEPLKPRRQRAGGLVATLFLRTYDRGERVHAAMLSRGFDGYCARPELPRLSRGQVAGTVLVAAALIGLRLGWG